MTKFARSAAASSAAGLADPFGRQLRVTKSELVKCGADWLADVLLKAASRDPALLDRICCDMREALSAATAETGLAGISDEPHMVGDSPPMRTVFDSIRRFAPTDLPILITGESGTGKELAALAIHERSPFAKGPFVAVNAAGLPPTLVASELFGHEKGAFTGATERRIGRIEQANGGTLFLDEIGDLPLDLQAHLLRFLQERTIQRVGGHGDIKVAARVVAATNVDLEKAVAQGRFRQDLFFRLDVLRLHLPPLRDRHGDAELLARYFIDRVCHEFGRPPLTLAADAIEFIQTHDWPGNVRELISKIRRAVLVCDGQTIRARDLHPEPPHAMPSRTRETTLHGTLSTMEGRLLVDALQASGFNVTRAARALGVSRITVYKLMKKYRVTRPNGSSSV